MASYVDVQGTYISSKIETILTNIRNKEENEGIIFRRRTRFFPKWSVAAHALQSRLALPCAKRREKTPASHPPWTLVRMR